MQPGRALAMLLGAALACLPAQAQQSKTYRVVYIAAGSSAQELRRNPAYLEFVETLRKAGYAEGRNLVMDLRSLEGRLEGGPALLADLSRQKPDVIFSTSQVIFERSPGATGNIPIVMIAGWNIVETGLAKSLARPGGTITGILVDIDVGLETKRLELLREIMPRVKRVAILAPDDTWWENPSGKQTRAAAQRLGITLINAVYAGADIKPGFSIIERESPEAVFVPVGPRGYVHRQRIGEFVSAKRLPCTAAIKEMAEHGCLFSYGVDTNDLLRRSAGYVAKILAGAKPGDLPIEQPSKFELVINLKASRSIGLTIPQSILARADRIID